MKRTYIQPQMNVNEFQLEGLIAASIKIDGDPNKAIDTSNGDQLSNKYNSPWSSTNWEN